MKRKNKLTVLFMVVTMAISSVMTVFAASTDPAKCLATEEKKSVFILIS